MENSLDSLLSDSMVDVKVKKQAVVNEAKAAARDEKVKVSKEQQLQNALATFEGPDRVSGPEVLKNIDQMMEVMTAIYEQRNDDEVNPLQLTGALAYIQTQATAIRKAILPETNRAYYVANDWTNEDKVVMNMFTFEPNYKNAKWTFSKDCIKLRKELALLEAREKRVSKKTGNRIAKQSVPAPNLMKDQAFRVSHV